MHLKRMAVVFVAIEAVLGCVGARQPDAARRSRTLRVTDIRTEKILFSGSMAPHGPRSISLPGYGSLEVVRVMGGEVWCTISESDPDVEQNRILQRRRCAIDLSDDSTICFPRQAFADLLADGGQRDAVVVEGCITSPYVRLCAGQWPLDEMREQLGDGAK